MASDDGGDRVTPGDEKRGRDMLEEFRRANRRHAVRLRSLAVGVVALGAIALWMLLR